MKQSTRARIAYERGRLRLAIRRSAGVLPLTIPGSASATWMVVVVILTGAAAWRGRTLGQAVAPAVLLGAAGVGSNLLAKEAGFLAATCGGDASCLLWLGLGCTAAAALAFRLRRLTFPAVALGGCVASLACGPTAMALGFAALCGAAVP